MFAVAFREVVPVAATTVEPRLANEMLLALKVRLLKEVLAPTGLLRVIFPVPVWIVRLRPATFPFTVPEIEILPAPPLVDRVSEAAITVLPVSVISLAFVVRFPPSWIVADAVSCTAPVEASELLCNRVAPDAVKHPKGVMLPTAALKVTFPVEAANVRQAGPSTVFEKMILPPLLVKVAGRRTLTAPVWEILALLVVSVPPVLTGPVPFCVKAPSSVIVLAPVPVSRPLFVTVSGPPFVVVTVPLLTNALPTSVMPAIVLVFRLPFSVAVPVPL